MFNERLAGGGVMTLSSLCAKSRQARLEKRAGCPTEGSLHLGKNNLKMLSKKELDVVPPKLVAKNTEKRDDC